MATFLVDTNILVYGVDASEPSKRSRAQEVLDRLFDTGSGVLSVQVLGEYLTSTARLPAVPFTAFQAAASALDWGTSWPVLDLTLATFRKAAQGMADHQLSYWDALLWATAKLNEVPNILTEDLQDGQLIEGVRILNPLLPSFDLARLG